jgi:large subunit ribosomal protein L37Ae
MGRTKKIGSAGKFGPRYGMRLRRKWVEIDRKQRLRHVCPVCQRRGVKRVASGIWACRKCGAKFTGGAYIPQTATALTVERAVKKVAGA